jgi:hypothetical protein
VIVNVVSYLRKEREITVALETKVFNEAYGHTNNEVSDQLKICKKDLRDLYKLVTVFTIFKSKTAKRWTYS